MKRITQSKGDCPGAPELRINKFIENVSELLHASDSIGSKEGVITGYIDDLYWAATFRKMIYER